MFKTKYRIVELNTGDFVIQRKYLFFIKDYVYKSYYGIFWVFLDPAEATRCSSIEDAEELLKRYLNYVESNNIKVKRVVK